MVRYLALDRPTNNIIIIEKTMANGEIILAEDEVRDEPFIIEFDLKCDICDTITGKVELPYARFKGKTITNKFLGLKVRCDDHQDQD